MQCLLRLLREDELRDQVNELASQPEYEFARPALLACAARGSGSATDGVAGFPNLGNTCYINAVVQCLYHTPPFRHDVEKFS